MSKLKVVNDSVMTFRSIMEKIRAPKMSSYSEPSQLSDEASYHTISVKYFRIIIFRIISPI